MNEDLLNGHGGDLELLCKHCTTHNGWRVTSAMSILLMEFAIAASIPTRSNTSSSQLSCTMSSLSFQSVKIETFSDASLIYKQQIKTLLSCHTFHSQDKHMLFMTLLCIHNCAYRHVNIWSYTQPSCKARWDSPSRQLVHKLLFMALSLKQASKRYHTHNNYLFESGEVPRVINSRIRSGEVSALDLQLSIQPPCMKQKHTVCVCIFTSEHLSQCTLLEESWTCQCPCSQIRFRLHVGRLDCRSTNGHTHKRDVYRLQHGEEKEPVWGGNSIATENAHWGQRSSQ